MALKCEVERGSTFTISCDLSYLTPILFVNVNFYARKEGKNYVTVCDSDKDKTFI